MDPFLLILAAVTAFIIFRLISVMGTRTGHEQRHDLESLRRDDRRNPDDSRESDSDEEEPVPPKPVSTNARALRDADPTFDEDAFLRGARSAYEMIVEAFASGDIRSIRPYLNGSVYDAFKSAIAARDAAGYSSDLKFVGIDRAAIVDSRIDDAAMTVVTEFTSNQVRVTRDKDGNIIEGDPNRIDLVKDRWTFTRKRNSNDPNWILVATGGAD